MGRNNSLLYSECSRWVPYVTDLFLPIIDSETGDFRSLPFDGSIADQPYLTMQVLKLIQLNYRKHLADKMKKIKTSKPLR